MDIKQLQYFVVSVDMGSFHSASEVLITTQPNVSKIVKSLEDELGMELLRRTRSGVEITPQGELIYRYAIDILKSMKTIRELKDGQGLQRLSICSVPSNQVTRVMSEFYRDQDDDMKNFQMEYWEDNVEELVTRVHKRKSELGFVYLSHKNIAAFNNHIKMKGLKFYELGKYPLYLYTSKANGWSKFDTISEAMLSKIKFVQYREGQYSLYSHLGHLKEDVIYGGDYAEVAISNSNHFLIQMLKNTEYCSISSSFIKNEFKDEGIVAIPIEPLEVSVSFGYIKRSRDNLTPLAQNFLEYMLKHYIQRTKAKLEKTEVDKI